MTADSAGSTQRQGMLHRLGLHRPELRAWALYDFGNSAFMVVIITALFPIFFARVCSAGVPSEVTQTRFSAATTIALVLIALLAPILGALADSRPIKKKLIAGFLTIAVIPVALMFFLDEGQWLAALVLFMIANFAANGTFVFYDSLLPHIARPHEVDRVSTAGYALGYIGGGLLLALNLAWIMYPAAFGLPHGPAATPSEQTLPVRLAFLSVAVWWVLFSLPLFRRVPEPVVRNAPEDRGQGVLRTAFTSLIHTFSELRKFRNASLMLLAFLIYNDGIGTIIRMAVIFGTGLGFGEGPMIAAILLTQFVGVPFAFLFGALAGKLGAKRSIFAALAVYTGISILGYHMTTVTEFLILAVLVGMVQGGSQALSRSLFASLIPRHKAGEFFGFFAVVEKFAGILGPLTYALAVTVTGEPRLAILSIIGFFVLGGVILARVDVAEGQRLARLAEEERVVEA